MIQRHLVQPNIQLLSDRYQQIILEVIKHFALGFSPFQKELSDDIDSYIGFFQYSLSLFDETLSNVISLTADHCKTNKSLAGKTELKFIVCASHLFDVTPKTIIDSENSLIR